MRMLRIERAGAEFVNLFEVYKLLDFVIFDCVDFADLVGGAEAVEEA